jgi:hypothetical protein
MTDAFRRGLRVQDMRATSQIGSGEGTVQFNFVNFAMKGRNIRAYRPR